MSSQLPDCFVRRTETPPRLSSVSSLLHPFFASCRRQYLGQRCRVAGYCSRTENRGCNYRASFSSRSALTSGHFASFSNLYIGNSQPRRPHHNELRACSVSLSLTFCITALKILPCTLHGSPNFVSTSKVDSNYVKDSRAP